MVLDLFEGLPSDGSSFHRSGGSGRIVTTPSRQRSGNGSRRGHGRSSRTGLSESRVDYHKLFADCVVQVQRNLKGHIQSPSSLHVLASYYTKVHPYIEGRPFCVSLSYATFLFHMQMSRISVQDVDLYVQLIATVLSQIDEDAQMTHPFVQQVLRDHVFGLPSPTCHGGAHCVVLVPPQQYRGFAEMTTSLLALDVVPADIVYQFEDKLEHYCGAQSPLVANRALGLLVHTISRVRVDEQVTALQSVLKRKSATINVDFLLACYERLKRAVPDPADGPTYGRALSIHCSEIFLRFRSPIRREYVERFLYPSLCHDDMKPFLEIKATREHLVKELLAQCTPGQSTTSPFYLCLCALMQDSFDNEIDGALEVVDCINCLMPHAAYFLSALAVDVHMSVTMFAKVIIALARGAGFAMTGRSFNDEVASSITENRTNVYNVLYTLREVTRNCSITSSRRATDMLKALRIAVPLRTIEALGKLALEAFDGKCDITVDPQLLCAELAMVLHQEHIDEAVQSSVDYFRDVSMVCNYCGLQCNSSLLCTVNGTVHITGHTAVSRVLSTLSECAGNKALEEKLISYLRNPQTQMDAAVHFMIYHILSNAGQHRNALFIALEPYIRSTLLALVSADRGGSGGRGYLGSEQKANVLMLHVKLVTLLSDTVEASYVESILKVFSELKIRTNHDALALWYMGNVLLRNCKGNVDLLPTDPQENNYCIDYPGCAPASATCADNAQLILKLIHRSHAFSPEMNKLVGCCVCKLIQDFNMQAPNISSALLGTFGFVTCNLESLVRFALPVGSGSKFWTFFLAQMKSSAPARTAFMTTLAKSVARRFRIDSPADAVTPFGVDPTGHIFCVMMFEAMKRDPALARVVLHMVSNWTKQADHTPGKFICLTYMCVQLVTVVAERGVGPAGVEVETETPQDQRMFEQAIKKAEKIMQSQQKRLRKLIPLVRRERNEKFARLLIRVDRTMTHVMRVTSGEIAPGTYDEAELEMENDEDAMYSRGDSMAMNNNGSFSLNELQQTADDSLFDYNNTDVGDAHVGVGADDDYNDGPDNNDDNDDYFNNYTATNYYNSSDDMNLVPRRETAAPHSRSDAEAASDILAELEKSARKDISALANSSNSDGHQHPRSILKHSSNKSTTSTAFSDNMDDVRLPQQRMRPISEDTVNRSRASSNIIVLKNVGTSPISLDGSSINRMRAKPMHSVSGEKRSHTIVSGEGEEFRHMQYPHDVDPSTSHEISANAWHEPDLFAMFNEASEESPIDSHQLPQLQAATNANQSGVNANVVLPSGMVLEYLRTHQGMDSLRDELAEVNPQAIARSQMNAYGTNYNDPSSYGRGDRVQANHGAGSAPAVMTEVTLDARANNYGRPHTDLVAPTKTVRVPVQMVDVVDRSAPVYEEGVVDGERPIRAVSEEVPIKQQTQQSASVRPQPATAPGATAVNNRGMQYFINQNQMQSIDSAVQDMQGFGQQRKSVDVLQTLEGGRVTALPTGALPQEQLLPTTPYGQVVIPACLVEQKNDTAIRELRQVMGNHDPNDTRLSASGKRKIRGSGGGSGTGPASEGNASPNNNNGGRESSGAWWTEMSSAPMPEYAMDPQYSMELF